MLISRRHSGFTLLGLLVAISILSAMALALPAIFSANQSARVAQYQSEQAYYTTNAAFEFALHQINVEGVSSTLPSREFAGTTFNISRASQRIIVTTTKGNANNAFSIDDPDVNSSTEATCLIVDISGASFKKNNMRLSGITLQKSATCPSPISIVSMNITWTPTNSNTISQVKIDETQYYVDSQNVPPTGSTHIFSSSFLLPDTSVYALTYVEWKPPKFDLITATLGFNMADGSTKTVVVTP